MSVGFGFSIGDIIAVSKIIGKVAIALKDSGGAASDYQLNRAEILGLQELLQRLQEDSDVDSKGNESSSSISSFEPIHRQARICEETLNEFLAETAKFDRALGPSAPSGWHRGSLRKVEWVMSGKIPKLWEKLGKQLEVLKLEMGAIDQQLLVQVGSGVEHIGNETRVGFSKMDTSLGELKGFSRSTSWKMNKIQSQLRTGIENSESNFTVLSKDINKIEDSAEHIKVGIDGLVSFYDDEFLHKVYDWLSPLAGVFENKHLDTINLKGRQDGLGKWLVETDEFKKWQNGTNEILCCCGGPGVGKTVLASFVIDYLQNPHSQPESPDIGVAFIYCDYKQASIQTSLNLIASVLHQLVLQKPILQLEFMALYKAHITRRTRPALGDYTPLLQSAVSNFSKVYLIVDALDECPEADGVRETFLDEVGSLDRVSLLATSRVMPLESAMERAVRLDIKAKDKDMKRYLEERLAKSDRIKKFAVKDPGLVKTIKDTILTKANGMFLLAVLHLESVLTKNNLRALKGALETLPDRIDSAYDSLLERINAQSSDDAEVATKVLYWITYAIRPLTLDEIQIALAVQPGDTSLDDDGFVDEERILAVCAGIVAIQEERKTISLVHYTAQEYLRNQSERHFPGAQAEIARTCLTYLLFDDFAEGPCVTDKKIDRRLELHQFLEYAARHWGEHFRQDKERLTKDLALTFLKYGAKIGCCIQVIHENINKPPGDLDLIHKTFRETQTTRLDIHGLWLAAIFKLKDIVEMMLAQGIDVKKKTGYGETALHPAARSGSVEVVKLLLDSGADINALNDSGVCALVIAAGRTRPDSLGRMPEADYDAVVKLLITRGADVKTCDSEGSSVFHLISSTANMEVVLLLLKKGVDMEAKDNEGNTALHMAVKSGHREIVSLLLDKGADIEAKLNLGHTPLHIAAENRQDVIAQLLLQRGADIVAKTKAGHTPLHVASEFANEVMIDLLLKGGSDINAKANKGGTVMHVAAGWGQQEMVMYMVEKGADINARTDKGYTALHIAADNGKIELVAKLLAKGIDKEIKSNRGFTALHIASTYGQLVVVVKLLEAGADTAARIDKGHSPLHLASEKGHEEIVVKLLEAGANVLALTDGGHSPVYIAAEYGHKRIVQMLLDKGADISGKTKLGFTPLHSASGNARMEVVELLLEKGADITAKTEKGRTCLHNAVERGHEEVVKLFLEKGGDLEARTKDESTPLHIAAQHSDETMVKLLLDKGVDIHARSRMATLDGYTSLHFALRRKHEEISMLLIERGADINRKTHHGITPLGIAALKGLNDMAKLLLEKGAECGMDNFGDTPLHKAAFNGHLGMMKMLIDRGVEVSPRSNFQATPLHWAAYNGHESTIRLLLDSGADVEAKAIYGSTPLHWAAANGQEGTARLLLEKGGSIKARMGYEGVLLWAAIGRWVGPPLQHGNDGFIPWLVSQLEIGQVWGDLGDVFKKNGPGTVVESGDGPTAQQLAVAQGHGEVALIIETAGDPTEKQEAKVRGSLESIAEGDEMVSADISAKIAGEVTVSLSLTVANRKIYE